MADENGNGQWFGNYLKWLEGAPLKVLQCRRDGHRFRDWESAARKPGMVRKIHGVVEIDAPCGNKCGVARTQFCDPETGELTRRNKIILDYSGNPAYLVPKEARSGRGFTREMRAAVRVETITRLAEWITDEDAD
jgi:hypothetical protein